MTRCTLTAVALVLAIAAPVAAQDESPEMEQQRCVWSCLANSPGNDSPEYNACVKQYCEDIGAEVAPAEPVPAPAEPAPASKKPTTAKPPMKRPAAPALPGLAVAPDAAQGWVMGDTSDGKGHYAGTKDAALGSSLNWLCGHGVQSLLALAPYTGDGKVVATVQGRAKEVQLQVENGVGYAPVGFAAPLFIHIAAGPEVEFTDSAGKLLGRFTMLNAPTAIGQAEGRCQSGT
ncbi:hypothetical protein [Fuscibacter oryzae]|uniref:Uncharacterized protein n=1 Tax=Fuscibacter oryzae TaxID=2803939 RepID=A0A8J7MPI0_9RHOB|nr:hypothetical protein [Fuscibacter oryzae]MBL4927603.1 hypothetical protein [Fuscibacter oryzae]